MNIRNCELGWYASRDTGRMINSGGPYSPIHEYLQLDGTWDLTTAYFETEEDLLTAQNVK